MTFEEALVSVWRQTLVDEADAIEVAGEKFSVRRTASRRLRQVDFRFEGHGFRGLEQNPKTNSRWAQLARAGKRVMQFLEDGRYVAVVVDGKLTRYGKLK
jgi:hypothetical protein